MKPNTNGAPRIEEMLTVPEISESTKLSRSHLYNEINKGRLVAYDLGGYRIYPADFTAWLQSKKKVTT